MCLCRTAIREIKAQGIRKKNLFVFLQPLSTCRCIFIKFLLIFITIIPISRNTQIWIYKISMKNYVRMLLILILPINIKNFYSHEYIHYKISKLSLSIEMTNYHHLTNRKKYSTLSTHIETSILNQVFNPSDINLNEIRQRNSHSYGFSSNEKK